MAATINEFAATATLLNRHTPSVEQRRVLLEKSIIPFNHALQQMIDSDPAATFTEAAQFLDGLYGSLNPDENPMRLRDKQKIFKRCLIGMKSEIIAEQLAGSLGIEVETASADEDICGTDRYFTIDGVRWPVDLKTSVAYAENCRAKQYRGSKLILALPLSRNEIASGTFRLSLAEVDRYKRPFADEISADLARVAALPPSFTLAR